MVDRSSGKQSGRAGGLGVMPGVASTFPPALVTHRMHRGISYRPEGGVTTDAVPVTVTYADSATSEGATTLSSMGLGTAAANRHIVVGIGNGGGAPATLSAVTVAGESCTKLIEITGDPHTAGLWIVALPAGTSGDVVLTMSDADPRIGVDTFAVYGASAIAFDTASDIKSNPLDLTISCPAGGCIIGKSFSGSASATWSNLTERNDETVILDYKHTCASDAFAAAQTDLAVSPNHGTVDCVGVAISLGPA